MKRSIHVSAPLLAAAALALTTGCRKPQMQRCVDEQNHVVPDSYCATSRHPPYHRSGTQCLDAQNSAVADNFCSGRVAGTSSGFVYYPGYRSYYGGGGGYGVGTFVSGGGYTPVAGASYATSTTRGGFGSSFGGSSSGDSAGGHGGSGGE